MLAGISIRGKFHEKAWGTFYGNDKELKEIGINEKQKVRVSKMLSLPHGSRMALLVEQRVFQTFLYEFPEFKYRIIPILRTHPN